VDGGSGSLLAHEIESWTSGGTSWIWVKVPRIDGGSNTDYIYLYYGKAGAASAENPAQVWDSHYRGVWHLGGGSTDSTVNANHGVDSVPPPGNASTKIGGGRDFDSATSQFINVGDDPSLRITGDLTLEAWAYKRLVDDSTIVGKNRGPGNNRSYRLAVNYAVAPNGPYMVLSQSGSFDPVGGFLEDPSSESVTTWQYIVGVHAGTTIRIYVDGSPTATNPASFATLNDNTPYNAIIGAEQDGATGWFDGLIDEVRISAVARTQDWVAAQYRSMTDTFVTFGPRETD
jgi:hypothetical protein